MQQHILHGIYRHIHPLKGFENVQLLEIAPGHSKISFKVTEDSLNLYGSLHGGFLFTLCDIAAGMSTYAYEMVNVTLQSDIHFISKISCGTLFVESNAIHKGVRTVVNDVKITSKEGTLISTATFTMCLLDPVESL